MKIPAIAAGVLCALGVRGQTSAYTDSRSGITFQAYTAPTGWRLGFVLPTSPGTDFIAQIVAPLDGGRSGWAGISLNGNMVGPLLIAAWPNGSSVGASFRKASTHANPPVYTGGSQSLNPIKAGTYVNGTHMSFTFLCSKCITGSPLTFDASSSGAGIGFALSNLLPSNPRIAAANLAPHSQVTAQVNMNLANAKSAQFSTWAASAGPAMEMA